MQASVARVMPVRQSSSRLGVQWPIHTDGSDLAGWVQWPMVARMSEQAGLGAVALGATVQQIKLGLSGDGAL